MTLQKALLRSTRVQHEIRISEYVKVDSCGVLCWYKKSNDNFLRAVSYDEIMRFDEYWTPYYSKPERCEACKLKEEYQHLMKNSMGCGGKIFTLLLSKHCECGGGG